MIKILLGMNPRFLRSVMARKYAKSETPSLGRGQAWQPTSGPSPYREHVEGGVSFPAIRNMEERALKHHDSSANAKKIARGARPAKKAAR
jgi:hypothetical protein